MDLFFYVQRGSADIWKENVIEEINAGEIKFETVEKFLAKIRRVFGGGDEESVKITKLKKIEQEGRIIEKFV